METFWRVPRLWRALVVVARLVVVGMARLRVSGEVPSGLRRGPLILAANHVSPFDPVLMAAACRAAGLYPRFMATGGVFRAPVIGWVMRHSGHIRVDRRTARVAQALPDAAAALAAGSVVLVYPEGRIGLDPWMWPERGKTGAARMAFLSGATVVPVAQWGAHEVLPYTSPRGLLGSVVRAVWRRPRVRVAFGTPVDLSGLDGSSPDDAVVATERIIEAITVTLAPLRVDEPRVPRFVDVTRKVDESRVRRGVPVVRAEKTTDMADQGKRFDSVAVVQLRDGPGSVGGGRCWRGRFRVLWRSWWGFRRWRGGLGLRRGCRGS